MSSLQRTISRALAVKGLNKKQAQRKRREIKENKAKRNEIKEQAKKTAKETG